MKKLCICRTCKSRFLIETGRDNCPKCGGILYKTDLEEKYWDLYNDDQRSEIVSKLMTEMEQDEQDKRVHNDSKQTMAQGYNSSEDSDSAGTSSKVKGVSGNWSKNPVLLLGVVAISILLVCAVIYFAGRYRNAKSNAGTAASIEGDTLQEGTVLSNAVAEEEQKQLDYIELYRDKDIVISYNPQKERFPYTSDTYGEAGFEFEIENLSDEILTYYAIDIMLQGMVFIPEYDSAYDVEPGQIAEMRIYIPYDVLEVAGIDEINDARFHIVSWSDNNGMEKEYIFETDGYAASADVHYVPEMLNIYENDKIIIRTTGLKENEDEVSYYFGCCYLLIENKSEEMLYIRDYHITSIGVPEDNLQLNGKEYFGFNLNTDIPLQSAAIVGGNLPKNIIDETGGAFESLIIPLAIADEQSHFQNYNVVITRDASGDHAYCEPWDEEEISEKKEKTETKTADSDSSSDNESANTEDATINYIMSHAAADSENTIAESEAGTNNISGNTTMSSETHTINNPYVFNDIVLDLPEDFVVMNQGNTVYAFIYTKDNMDTVKIVYTQINADVDLSAARVVTKADMENMLSGRNIPGYDGVLSFEKSEVEGYPAFQMSYHMSKGDNLILITEKYIFLENGYYSIEAYDNTEENTDVLNAVLNSITLTQ